MDTDSMMLSGPASWASTLSSRPPSSDGSHATFPDAPSPEWRPSKQRASPLRQPLPPLLPSSCQTPAIMLPVVQQQQPRKQQVGGRRRSEASSSDACGPMQRAGDAEAEVLGSHIRKTEQGLIDIGYRKRGRPPKNAAPESQPAAVPPLWQQISCPTGAAVNGSGAVAAADADAPAPAELPRQLAVKPCVDPPLPIPNHLFEALYSHMVPSDSRKLPRNSPDVATKFQFPASSTFLTPPTRKGPSVTPAKRQYSCPPVHLSSFSRPLGAKEDELAPELIAGGGLCPLDVRESLLGGCWGEGLN